MSIGHIHSIQSLGAADGPGLRCVVFFQGCPLRCIYCHNPDTWDFAGGMETTPEELTGKLLRFRTYMKHGGVTLSGGEPLAQPEFTLDLLKALKASSIHTAIDTSCHGDPKYWSDILDYTDLALVDVKFLTEADYRTHTKGSLETVKAFLTLATEKNVSVWVRHVVVPGINDTKDDILTLLDTIRPYSTVEKVELLPFQTLCLEKYQQLGIEFPLNGTKAMEKDAIAALMRLLPEKLR